MDSVLRFVALPSACSYLPDQSWQIEYNLVRSMSADEYMSYMRDGWRRFGHALFRPRCPECTACRSLRVLVDQFRPNRSQRRALRANQSEIRLQIGWPTVDDEKLELYDRYHAYQALSKDWPFHPPKDARDYVQSYVDNPFPTEEWCYYLGERLIGVGYVDALPGGLSAIYFFYDPLERERALGTYNVLKVIEIAAGRKLPHVYLGYFVEGCRSLEYKANFAPNQIRHPDGTWVDFRR